MATPHPILARVRGLTLRVADGLADEASMEELDGLLRGDPAARRSYLRMMDIHFDLERKAARGTLAVGNAGADLIEFPPELSDRRVRFIQFRVLAAAAVLALAAVGVWWAVKPAKMVATIGKGVGEVWQGRGAQDRVVRDGEDLKLAAGLVEMETSAGVRLVWEGPCHGRFDGPQQVRLLAGKLYAEVPKEAHGFTVITPVGKVVDLGTRFGVEVNGREAVAGVQVYEGRVIAKLDRAVASRSAELIAGEAGRMDGSAQVIEAAPFDDDRFAQMIGAFYEPFENRGESKPLAGRRGWFEAASEKGASHAHVRHRGMSYPGLASAQFDSLEIWPGKAPFSPPGHRWPFPFASAILQLDDDLVKQLRHRPDVENVTLLTLGVGNLSEPDRVRVVVCADGESGSHCRLGLAASGVATYSSDTYHQTQVFFAVLKVEGSVAQLWINPAPESLGTNRVPPPDVSLSLPAATPAKTLWIGQSENPTYTYWWLDELRGGHSWADVTPSIN